GTNIESLKTQMKNSWPAATHLDAYMVLNHVDGYDIVIKEGNPLVETGKSFPMLVIGNIGYYKEGEFTEFHKLIPFVLSGEKDSIVGKLKRDPEFAEGQHLDESTRSHLDDKHVVTAFDVDDVINVQKNISGYVIELVPSKEKIENILKLGYQFTDLRKM
ncbi:MAG: DUF1543 domain-containing protein, partial [Ignavibacteria bacterium]|nr:DUF1543 domain-containing protein [Ignavibacteria bacterium]